MGSNHEQQGVPCVNLHATLKGPTPPPGGYQSPTHWNKGCNGWASPPAPAG